jgi:hypothetical protein
MVRRLLGVVRGPGAGACLGLAVALCACASPTLPLPPPEDPTISPAGDPDHVKLEVPCGGADPGALIVVVNTNSTVPPDQAVSGAIVDSCGAWDTTTYAHSGDFLNVTQEVGIERSQPAVVQVH